MKRPTIVDIAKHIGMDKSTVSRALNNMPGVSNEAREKVLKAASELGYVRNIYAQWLRGWKSKTLGLTLWLEKTSFSASFYGPLILELCRAVAEREHDLVIVPTEHHQGEHLSQVLAKKGVAGTLLLGQQTMDLLDDIRDSKIPAIQVDNYSEEHPELGFVASRNENASYRITKYLIDLGHRRFAFTGDLGGISPFRERYQGFRRALSESDIEPIFIQGSDDSYRTQRSQQDTFRHVRSLIESDPQPTAIVAANDRRAEISIFAAQECGLQVPRDLSVTGFDDIPSSVTPSLTTVRVNLPELAEEAVDALLNQIGKPGGPVKIRIPTDLILRGSTGPAPKDV